MQVCFLDLQIHRRMTKSPMGENVGSLKINMNHLLDMPTTTPIMVSLNVIGFKLLSGKWFYDQVTVTLTFDILTQKSIGIICQPWLTKAPFMVSLSWRGFKLLSEQGFYAPDHCDRDLTSQKSKGIIYELWPSMIPRKVYIVEMLLKLKSGVDFANAGRTDGRRVP